MPQDLDSSIKKLMDSGASDDDITFFIQNYKPAEVKETPKVETPKVKTAEPKKPSFIDRVVKTAIGGAGGPAEILSRANQNLIKPAVEPSLPQMIPQLSGERPGIFNPNLEQNPLLMKSILPETEAEPGIVSGMRHGIYENLIRPSASPLGAATMFMGGNPAEHPKLPGITPPKPKPRMRANPDGTFTNQATGQVLDKTGKPIQGPVDKLLAALDDSVAKVEEQKGIYRTERAEKFARSREVPIESQESFFKSKGELAGEHTKVVREPLKLEQVDTDALFKTVGDAPLLQTEKIHAGTGLQKILSGAVPQENEIRILEKIFGPEVVGQIKSRLPKIDKKWSLVTDILNIPRAIQTSLDLSFGGRQGITMVHTRAWRQAWKESIKNFGSEDSFRGFQESIMAKPNAQRVVRPDKTLGPSIYERAKLALTDLTELASREESAQSTIAERLMPGVRASNRAHTTFGNKLRSDNFDLLYDQAKKIYETAKATGKARRGFFKESFTPDEVELLNPETNDHLLKLMGSYVNNATGRGNLGALEKIATELNTVIFAPKLIASRLQMMNPKNYIYANPMIRKQYLKSMTALATYWIGMAGLAKASGAEVVTDMTSADFGKIKIGNVRLDPAGGFQQYIVLMARMKEGEYTSSTTEETKEFGVGYGAKTRMDALQDFVYNKLAPIPSYGVGMARATDYRPFELGDRTLRMFTQLVIQDLSEIAQEDPNLLPLLIPAAGGMSIQQYGEREPGRLLPESVFPREADISFPKRKGWD